MPGRLIAFIIVLFIIIAFIGFNADNTTDIRIWFGEKGVLKDVRIFVSFFVMYLIGVLSALPFIFAWNHRKTRKIRDAEARLEEPRQTRKGRAAPWKNRAGKPAVGKSAARKSALLRRAGKTKADKTQGEALSGDGGDRGDDEKAEDR